MNFNYLLKYLLALFSFLLFSTSSLVSATNTAIVGTATQSSIGWSGAPGRAIDDNIDGVFNNGSVTHTLGSTEYEWWALDLGSTQHITEIDLYNRTDCCGNRLKNVHVMISDTPFTTGTTSTALANAISLSDWNNQVSSSPGVTETFSSINTNGRYILIQKAGGSNNDSNFLSLAEVQVWTNSAITPPVAEYRFDECSWTNGSADVNDSAGSIKGTSHNGANTNTDTADQILSNSGEFDGVDDYVSMGNSFNTIFGSGNDTFTITAWIKPRALSTDESNHDTANTFIAKASDSNNDNLEIGITTGGQLHLYLDTSGSDTQADFGSGISIDSWYFIAVTYDGSDVTVTINDSPTTDGRWSGYIDQANGSPFTIGTTLHSDTSFNGLIDEVKIFDVALSDSEIQLIYNNEKSGHEYTGGDREETICRISWCETNVLGTGFHIIDPDGGDDENSFEIYCDNSTGRWRDLIALPIRNDYNNFVFKDDSPQTNYYKAAEAAKTADTNNLFKHIEVIVNNDNTLNVVPNSLAEGTAGNSGYFSNLNFVGTPFTIDWDNTALSNCDTNKLRIGADNQAVKINTLDYTKGRCKVDSMKLKLFDDYKYLTWDDIDGGDEVLEETCRQIFEKVPDADGYLPSSSSNGHYWIDPDKGGRDSSDNTTTLFHPVVAYCQYQTDLQEAWTFIMALDGKVTNRKGDIKTMTQVKANPAVYHDTCSQFGLIFYVPNTKDTFNRVRDYLAENNKNRWINYTGTIREKYKIFTDNPGQEYYIPGEGYNEIWPYGPFGLYFPQEGRKDVNGSSWSWYPGTTSVMGNMSGRCMNSGGVDAANCTDHTTGGTMGDAGWRTTLQDMVETGGLTGISYHDQFWIADVGAGNYLHDSGATPECSITNPGSNRATSGACDKVYYEPNGNYIKDAWLNFISDSNGNVYHNDDNNAFYSYYDYMCMAWDNYRLVSRIVPIEGPFTVIDKNASNQPYHGKPADALNYGITTKIVKRVMDLQIVTFDRNHQESGATVDNNQSINAGVYLTYITKSGANDVYNESYYIGDIGGSNPSLAINNDGYHDLTAADLNGVQYIPDAKRQMQFRFKFCQYNNGDWGDCWQKDGTNTCKAGCSPEDASCNCQVASSDFFAVRPKEFTINSTSITDVKLLKSARTYLLEDIKAEDDTGNPSTLYDQVGDNIEHNSTIYLGTDIADTSMPPLLNGTVSLNKIGAFDFTNGVSNGELNVSFDDVAKINIEIYDNDWASIDSTDSQDICNNDTPPYGRRICSADANLTFIPDHFEVADLNLTNHDQRFTYLTYRNDLNMSAPLSVLLKAMNAEGDVTQNFRNGAEFYENPVALSIIVPVKDENTADINLTIAKHDIPAPTILGFGGSDANGTHSIAWNESNATQKLMFNYNKVINTAKNPFNISGTDVNLSITSTYTGDSSSSTIEGMNSGVGRATFYYAKIKSSEYFYQGVTTPTKQTPISIRIYCDQNLSTCAAFGINTVSGATDEAGRWYLSLGHMKSQGDGDIALKSESAALIEGIGSPTVDNVTNPNGAAIIIEPADLGDKNATIGTGVGPSLPMTVGIEAVIKGDTFSPPHTDRWLAYNKDSAFPIFPIPLYKVRFIGAESDWAGVGKTGHAMDINISVDSTRRMDW